MFSSKIILKSAYQNVVIESVIDFLSCYVKFVVSGEEIFLTC